MNEIVSLKKIIREYSASYINTALAYETGGVANNQKTVNTMSSFVQTCVLTLLVICLSGGYSWPARLIKKSNECLDFFQAVIAVRDNRFVKFELSLFVDDLTKEYEDIIFNDDVVKHYTCLIVESSTIEELAEKLVVNPQALRDRLRGFSFIAGLVKEHLKNFELKAIAAMHWMRKSGFPATWPLKTTFDENLELLGLIDPFGEMDQATKIEGATLLTNSASLDEFLNAVNINKNSDIWQEAMELSAILVSENGESAIVEAFDQQEQLIVAILDLDIFN